MPTIEITKEMADDPIGLITLSGLIADAEEQAKGESLTLVCRHPSAWKLLRAYDDTRHPSWRDGIDKKTRELLGGA